MIYTFSANDKSGFCELSAAQAAENHGNEWECTMTDIYINPNLNPLKQFNSSSRRTEFKDIFLRKISPMITKTVPISTRTVISYAMKRGDPLGIWWKVNGNWDNNMIRIFQWMENQCRTHTTVRRNKNSRTVRITV